MECVDKHISCWIPVVRDLQFESILRSRTVLVLRVFCQVMIFLMLLISNTNKKD